MTDDAPRPLTVVGIGADGWAGLSPAAAEALCDANVVVGSARQLALVADQVRRTEAWPSPMSEAIGTLLERFPGQRIAVLASGDPMFYGVGTSLVEAHGADRVTVVPHPSSISLACARLGWDMAAIDVASAVGRPLAAVARYLHPGRRVLVLVSEDDAAGRIAKLLCDSGFGPTTIRVLQQLGGPDEAILTGTATSWEARLHNPLAIVALDLAVSPDAAPPGLTPGLADETYDHDGALTKQEIRAVTLAALAPHPGELLWDVGAGSGSIAIEWMRAHPANVAVAIEPRPDRSARIAANADRLGVPGLRIVEGEAPGVLEHLPTPDAIFVGGGLTDPGVLDACLAAIRPGGRFIANAVTIETEALVIETQARLGGRLTRIAISHADPMGSFTAFRPTLPVTQWIWRRPDTAPEDPTEDQS